MGKTVGKELKQALHPQVVAPVRMDGKVVNHETIRTTNVYVAAYIFIFAASFMLVSLDGFDMVTNFTAIAGLAQAVRGPFPARENSGSSSRKRTPQLARLHSPGRNCAPPPASAAELAEWWGLHGKRRAVTRPRPAGICPAMEGGRKSSSSPQLLPGSGAAGCRAGGGPAWICRCREHRRAGRCVRPQPR